MSRSRALRKRSTTLVATALSLLVVATASSAGFKQAPGAPFSTVGAPQWVVATDLNGDGKPDVVVIAADPVSGHLYLRTFLGNGTGGFAPAGTPAQLADDASAFVLGDVNGDHHLDAVVTNNTQDSLSIFLGDGKGNFTQAGGNIQLHGGSDPDVATIADLNGDGKPDLVVPNQYVAGVDFLEGNGTGGFTPFSGSPYLFQNQLGNPNYLDEPVTAVVGNFDGNSYPDVAIADFQSAANANVGAVMVFSGAGDGTFTLAHTLTLDGHPSWLAAGDLNNDGHEDLVVSEAQANEVQALLGDGAGSFAVQPGVTVPAPGSVVVGDFNGDGRPDVGTLDFAGSGTAAVLLGDDSGALVQEPGGPFPLPNVANASLWDVDAADVNRDKRTDLVVTDNGTHKADVLLSQGGALATGTVSPVAAVVGSTLTIVGTNLDTVAFVNFGGPSGEIQTRTAGQITVTVPNGANLGKLALIGADGTSATVNVFTPILAPVISGTAPIDPAPGTKAGAIETINGQHLTGTTSVSFGGIPATWFKVVSDAKITAVVPANAGTPITVTNPVSSASTPFVLIQSPSVDSFSPTHGPANPTKTTTVHLSGHDMQGVTSVTFGGIPAPAASISISVDGQSLQVDAPPTAKTGPIIVKNIAGSYSTSLNADPNKTFTVDPPPVIKSLSATSGVTGATITIAGTDLIGITEVDFAGIPGTSLDTSGAPTSISVEVPAHAGIGKVTAVGTNGTATSALIFTPHIAPILSSVSPAIGALPGASIRISGFHFVGTKTVSFAASGGGAVNGTFKVVSDLSLSVQIPATAVTGTVTVTNAYGATGISYYVVQTPVLAHTGSFSPSAGSKTSAVTITGMHLGGTQSVKFNGNTVRFSVDSDTQITAHPTAIADSGVVSVTNAAGTATTSDSYTVVAVTNFSPASGGIGQVVTVYGSGFLAVTGVSLPGQGMVAPSNVSGSQFTVTVQSCATTTTGPIVIWVGPVEIQTGNNFALTSDGPC